MIKDLQPLSDNDQSGFSAVELLITLFIAAMFIVAGYQLYSFSFARSIEAGQDARASDLAYDLLQAYKRGEIPDETEDDACTSTARQIGEFDSNDNYLGIAVDTTPASPYQPLGSRDLSIVLASLAIECPYTGDSGLEDVARITSSITYKTGSNTETVSYATYENM